MDFILCLETEAEEGGVMLRVEASVEIARSPEDVFAFACEIDKLPLWLTGIIEAKQITEGAFQKGTEFEHVHTFLGKRFTARYETTEYEADRRIAFRSISGPIDLETWVTYERVNGGTRVRQVVEGDPRGFFKVAEPVLVKLVGRQLKGSLENLKDILEADGAAM
jgi:uncharacterized protein YndB with AHSA1/START domain